MSTVIQPRKSPAKMEDLAVEVDSGLIAEELTNLPEDRLLLRSGLKKVWFAGADEIPQTLLEIGRLRELSFRLAGEGTGRSRDIDRFDESYRQLFIWDHEVGKIVGGYRIGCAHELIRAGGQEALYTASLFDFEDVFFESIGPALEMGRSFIRPEYQRSFGALLLLWKGIGHFIATRPDCATLFGPVSVSQDYSSISRQLIASFLGENNRLHPFSHWIKARRPFPVEGERLVKKILKQEGSIEDLSRAISGLEEDGKGMPVLLRQYLRLGGEILGFNLDPDFTDVLDLLLMVDLRKTPKKTLARYMGQEGTADFLGYHGVA